MILVIYFYKWLLTLQETHQLIERISYKKLWVNSINSLSLVTELWEIHTQSYKRLLPIIFYHDYHW